MIDVAEEINDKNLKKENIIKKDETKDENNLKKETKLLNSESSSNSEKDNSSDDSSVEEDSDKHSDSSKDCNCDENHENHQEEMDSKNYVNLAESSIFKKKHPDPKFYEKMILEKKEHEKKYEKIRKKMEEELKIRSKPVINEESKKIMEKKQGFVKPIYQRAKEVEESKKNKIQTIKKNIEEKKAKIDEDDMQKSKFHKKNKQHHYNETEFSEWRNNQLNWETQKNKKIQDCKENFQKQQLETVSKFYHPVIDKNSEYLAKSKNTNNIDNVSVFQKLYDLNEEKQKKLALKTIEALPDFKPSINKKVPKYLKNKVHIKNDFNNQFFSKNVSELKKSKANNNRNLSIEIPSNYNQLTTVSRSERTGLSIVMNSSTIETNSNPIILNNDSDDEDQNNDVHDDVVSQYKKALEQNRPVPFTKTSKMNVNFDEDNTSSLNDNVPTEMNENKETIIIENTEKKILLTNNIEKKINDLIDNKPLKILENRTENSLMNDSKIMKNTLTKTQNVKESKTVVNNIKNVPLKSNNNKEMIEFYNKKIEVLINCLKKAKKIK